MNWLRRGWLAAIACAVVVAGGSALVMRFDQLDPGPTISPVTYGHALALHGLLAMAVLAGALLAIPSFVVRPSRTSVVLGALALALWAAAIVPLGALAVRDAQEWGGHSPQQLLLVLAASLALGAAQLAVSLPATAGPQRIAAVGSLASLAIVVTPLVGRDLPTAFYWLLATTAIACALVPDAIPRIGRSFALLAIAPCLVLAWIATAAVHSVHTGYFHDTLGVLSPLPLTGGALLGALIIAATRTRSPHRRLAQIAAVLINTGASLTSVGFYLLGSRGMPRRYLAYLPELQSLQLLVGLAAVIAAVGCITALEAFRRGDDR